VTCSVPKKLGSMASPDGWSEGGRITQGAVIRHPARAQE
jgi:hypothetical protein